MFGLQTFEEIVEVPLSAWGMVILLGITVYLFARINPYAPVCPLAFTYPYAFEPVHIRMPFDPYNLHAIHLCLRACVRMYPRWHTWCGIFRFRSAVVAMVLP